MERGQRAQALRYRETWNQAEILLCPLIYRGINPTQITYTPRWALYTVLYAHIHRRHGLSQPPTAENADWVLTTTDYGEEFISSVQKGNVLATQFHPEKSGEAGVDVYRRFIFSDSMTPPPEECAGVTINPSPAPTALAPRVIACLDVRSNDDGDLVVTKGDQCVPTPHLCATPPSLRVVRQVRRQGKVRQSRSAQSGQARASIRQT